MSESSTEQRTDLEAAVDAAVDAGMERSQINAVTQPVTSVDAAGTERIVTTPRPGGFTPAPVEVSPEHIARAEARERLHEAQRDARLSGTGSTAVAASDAETTPPPAEPTPHTTTSPAAASTQTSAGSPSPAPSQPPAGHGSPTTPPTPGAPAVVSTGVTPGGAGGSSQAGSAGSTTPGGSQ